MKRSEINGLIRRAEQFIGKQQFALPPFAHWTPADWQGKGPECDEIRDNMLGWDVTDYGLGKFGEVGLVLVTIRNGNQNNPAYRKPYAEKLLISEEGQVAPMHFHWNKMEDIINRGGGTLVMKLYNADAGDGLDSTDVDVVCDGVRMTVPAGTELELKPGESVALTPRMYHAFWAKKGCGPVLIGEVSQCNDDNTDNRFYESVGRFPRIDEDEAPYRLLCNEYPRPAL
ncbi:MAG: D-lyxose/D-mannose family sugar isomerase [Clostridiales Family XIII bacterium]|jgi:D-lyxose ketol-isomerase|nr:D-lyxose/D-mannose family sugar isomerase [Clostridiales Family XIII bacterium]